MVLSKGMNVKGVIASDFLCGYKRDTSTQDTQETVGLYSRCMGFPLTSLKCPSFRFLCFWLLKM